MTGKTLQQLSSAELRSECSARGLSVSGSKSDVYVRLEEHLRESGLVPENVRFETVQPLISGLQGSTEQQQPTTSALENTNASQIFSPPSGGILTSPTASQKPTDNRSEIGGSQPTIQQGQSAQPLKPTFSKPRRHNYNS